MPIKADLSKSKTIYLKKPSTSTNLNWWEDPNPHLSIFNICNSIITNLSVRKRQNYFFSSIYNDIGYPFLGSKYTNLYYNRTAVDGHNYGSSSMSMNILQNVIDSACSIIAKNKPKIQFQSDDAKDYQIKVRGKLLTKYVQSGLEKANIYEINNKVFQSACVFGTGAIKLFIEDNQIKAEHIFIEELLIDELDGMHQEPRQMHQRKYKPREEIMAQFPKLADKIKDIPTVATTASMSTVELIPIIESWHLPSSIKSKDGRHTISVENCTLFEESYDKDFFPIIFFRWANQTLGFWGRGICHEIWKMQRELDRLLTVIQICMRIAAGGVITVESGSNIMEDHLTSNKLFKILEYANIKPDYLLPPLVQPEIYQHIQTLSDNMYKVTGVAQAQSTGNKPPEVKSGVAIRETNDLAAGRLELIGQSWEKFYIDISKLFVSLSEDLAKTNKDLSILASSNSGATSLYWKDVKLDLDQCILKAFPISGLSHTPAERLDQLMDFAQAGYFTKEQVMDLVDWPDLSATVSLEIAPLNLLQEILSNIKIHGESAYMAPSPYLDMDMAYRMTCLEIDRAQLQNVPEDHIDQLRRFADAIKSLQQFIPPAPPQQNTGTPAQVLPNSK